MEETKEINYDLLFQMIECVKREVKLRYAVYSGRIKAGKMTEDEAKKEQRLMWQVQKTLEKIYNNQAPQQVQQALFDTDIYKPKRWYDNYPS